MTDSQGKPLAQILLELLKLSNPKFAHPALPILSHGNHIKVLPTVPPSSWLTSLLPHVALHHMLMGTVNIKSEKPFLVSLL